MTPSLLRFAGAAAFALTAVCAVGAWPTWRAAGENGLLSMGLAVGISFVGAVLAFVPSALASDRYESRLQAALLGIVVRLFVTMVAVFVVLAGDLAPARMPFVVWIGLGYGVLLVLETLAVLKTARRAEDDRRAASA